MDIIEKFFDEAMKEINFDSQNGICEYPGAWDNNYIDLDDLYPILEHLKEKIIDVFEDEDEE